MKYSGIGGQAVLEGVMMKNKEKYAVAVRKPDGEITVDTKEYYGLIKNKTLRNIPILRGVLSFVESLTLGISTLTYSASFFEEDEEDTKAKKKELSKEAAAKKEKAEMGITVAFSFVLAIGIFMILPYYLSLIFQKFITSHVALALIEGIIRMMIFLAYIASISLMKDIQRVFMYHGAEHKCINCIEHGMELNVENVRKSSRLHKRCGTSFLLFVMIISIISEDDVKISNSARKLVETARNKVSDFHTMHFSSINGEIREIPAEYKCENLFKLDLKATSISGEQSAFEGCSENQSEVFEKWLDENASEYLTEDEMKDLKEKINAMTADVDFLNAQEGYRGTSYESVFLLSASEAGLRKVNEMYVPEQLQAGFSDMIDEYVHFNDSARNSIMEKMTPDYMVVGIGSKTESYKYKSEIISDETAFYTNEKKEISGICNQFLNGKTDQKLFCNEMKDRLNDYYGSRYELRNQPEAVEGRVNNMLDKLQHMFGV